MSKFNTLDDLDLSGKRVLVRVDLNVPLANGKISDATRIERIVPTIKEIANSGAKAILLSHFGRPGGKPNPEMSLKITVDTIHDLTKEKTIFVETDWNDVSAAKEAIDQAAPGSVIVMENTRFHPGEEKNDHELAARMASLGDIYINDAFSSAHRAHASTEALAHLLPNAAGRAMQKELEALNSALGSPARPVIALVGGAKVSSKIDLLENLIEKVDALVIGGGMANTFLNAIGFNVGKSLCEKELAPTASRIMDKATDSQCAIILPVDGVVAWHFEAGAPNRLYGVDAIDPDGMMLDIGPSSIERIKGAIDDAKTLIWNGPLGAFELHPFDRGTVEVARYAAERTKKGQLVSVAGGGDTVAALAHAGVKDDFTYVSSAGGAFLEWMEGKALPGVMALEN
ncbi:Phosphoglycerate kinase [hydrothermal vent metagenome]|uniref:phosphoglycerate kinase n=1 Tax=hydrothermal vent metagenome TaxID=652676 RepID=A0A3B0TJY3_9ZZZZ